MSELPVMWGESDFTGGLTEVSLARFGGRCEKHCSIKPCLACDNETLRAALAKAEQERDGFKTVMQVALAERDAVRIECDLALGTIESRDQNIATLIEANKELQSGPLSEEAYDIAQNRIRALQLHHVFDDR